MSLGRANPNLFSFLTCGRSFFESLLEEGLPRLPFKTYFTISMENAGGFKLF